VVNHHGDEVLKVYDLRVGRRNVRLVAARPYGEALRPRRTVTHPLDQFATTLVTPAPDRTVVAERRERVVKLLAPVGVWQMFESGSFSHGTAVPVHSDVDYMARTDLDKKPSDPATALRRVKDALVDSYEFRSIKISSPSVKVEFWTPPHFEVAPAFWETKSGNDDVFHIAGPNSEWVLSAPSAHNRYVTEQNDRLGKKVKPLVRLLKAWKYYTGAPVSSTYLELRTAQYLAGESSVIYKYDLPTMFRKIIAAELAPMNDPLGIVKRIRACSSEANRSTTLAAMRCARTSLEAAASAEADGSAGTYWLRMSELFGNAFPYRSW
jgi:hypothetical protein